MFLLPHLPAEASTSRAHSGESESDAEVDGQTLLYVEPRQSLVSNELLARGVC